MDMLKAAPRLLVFQHIPIEHPGIFRDFLAEDGAQWDAVELDAGETIPDLGDYDALWVMGGPMDVWEEGEHPWLKREKAAIREAVAERAMPCLGVCLGHQLLAEALGGAVGKMTAPEVGVLSVELTDEGRSSPIFAGLPARQACLQWHGAEVQDLPEGGRILASSPACPVQAMAVGPRAFGVQYHVELTPHTVREWAEVPAYAAALERALGAGAIESLDERADAAMAAFNGSARQLYRNFMALVEGCRQRIRR
jgi:GMP synthase-like glutamine amidotransferase